MILFRALNHAGNACIAAGFEREVPVQYQAPVQSYQTFQPGRSAGTSVVMYTRMELCLYLCCTLMSRCGKGEPGQLGQGLEHWRRGPACRS